MVSALRDLVETEISASMWMRRDIPEILLGGACLSTCGSRLSMVCFERTRHLAMIH